MKKAFTLIELLVVIAIIAILAAILFPVFAQAKLAAKKTNDLAQLKQLSLSSVMYSTDSDDMAMAFPYAADWSTPAYNARQKGPWWSDRIMPYVKNKGIFANPSNTDTLFDCDGYWKPGATSATDANTQDFYRVTYTFNHLISHADFDPDAPGAASMTGIPDVAGTVLLGPSDNWFSRSSCQPNGSANTVDLDWDVSTGGWGYELWGGSLTGNLVSSGFNTGANFAFSDGHAKYSKMSIGGDSVLGTVPEGGIILTYAGYFPNAKTRPNFGGACETQYDPTVYAY